MEDDRTGPEASCFRETLWRTAQDAIASAGDRQVVFGLTEGSRRTTCALMTAFFQLLAREPDILVDVRVTDPRVDGDVPFFFPEQKERELLHEFSVIDARRVEVALVELDLPRLAGMLEGEALTSYDSALRIAKARPESSPPPVVIDLSRGWVTIDGLEVDLSTAERFWYAYLGWRRGRDDGRMGAGGAGRARRVPLLPGPRGSGAMGLFDPHQTAAAAPVGRVRPRRRHAKPPREDRAAAQALVHRSSSGAGRAWRNRCPTDMAGNGSRFLRTGSASSASTDENASLLRTGPPRNRIGR